MDPRDDTPSAADGEPPAKSFGNISASHWSRARVDLNQEALDYYRERSHAPGVEAGGGSRNHYCMQCDGVIPFEHAEPACPHCGAVLAGEVRRYFNWVEINEPPKSDARALLPWAAAALALLALAAWGLWALLG